MRWFSRFAIVLYLSIVCSPQAMVMHDVRLSPLADSQIQALPPSALLQAVGQLSEADDEPPLLPAAAIVRSCYFVSIAPATGVAFGYSPVELCLHPPRAPPVILSL